MRMHKRTNLVMQFSSFLCLKEESSSLITYWKITPELEQNMKQLFARQEITSVDGDVIAKEFLQCLTKNQDSLKKKHLVAYLQESCFFATKKVYQRFKNYKNFFTWQDYFQWANLFLASPTQLLAKYSQSSHYRLTTYARSKIEYQLIDQTYRFMGWERASDWGLLRQLKTGTRKKCLQLIGGLRGNDLEKYLLVWECFNLVYSPQGLKRNQTLPPPSSQDFLLVSKEYNFICQKHNLNLPSLTEEKSRKIITQCIKFARVYCNPKTLNSSDSLDYFINSCGDFIQEEREIQNEEYSQVNIVLMEGFSELTFEEKILLYLWKGLELTQTEIAEIMVINYENFIKEQYQVARQISFTRKKLLEKLIKAILVDSQIKLTQEKLKELKNPLDNWLKEYCQDIISRKIMSIYQSLSSGQKSLIRENFQDNSINDASILYGNLLGLIANKLRIRIAQEYKLFFPDTVQINTTFINKVEDWFINNISILFE